MWTSIARQLLTQEKQLLCITTREDIQSPTAATNEVDEGHDNDEDDEDDYYDDEDDDDDDDTDEDDADDDDSFWEDHHMWTRYLDKDFSVFTFFSAYTGAWPYLVSV